METFGLMQLLSTLLPAAAKTEEKSEESAPPPPAVVEPQTTEKTNACLQFFERHDRVAKNRKR